MYTVEYRRKTGCTINVGMKNVKARNEVVARKIFLEEIVKEYPISDFEVIRITKAEEQ